MKWCKTFRFNRLGQMQNLYQKQYSHSHQFADMHSAQCTCTDQQINTILISVVMAAMIFQARFYCFSQTRLIGRWQPGAYWHVLVSTFYTEEMASIVISIQPFHVLEWLVYSATDEIWLNAVWNSTPNQSIFTSMFVTNLLCFDFSY